MIAKNYRQTRTFPMKLNNRYISNRLMSCPPLHPVRFFWTRRCVYRRGESITMALEKRSIGATSDFAVRRADFRKRGET